MHLDKVKSSAFLLKIMFINQHFISVTLRKDLENILISPYPS